MSSSTTNASPLSLSRKTIVSCFLFYLLGQPLILYVLTAYRCSRFLRWTAAVSFFGITLRLSQLVLAEIGVLDPPMLVAALPIAMLSGKIIHALAVGPKVFCQTYGLSSFLRIALFAWLVPTVTFLDAPVMGDKANSRKRGALVLARGLAQATTMGVVIASLSYLGQERVESLPLQLQHFLLFYCIMLANGSFSDLLFNGPTRLVFGNRVLVEELATVPVLTRHGRDFWRRWSKCYGVHLRKAFYEPLGGRRRNVLLATAVPFGVNCLVHTFWWAPLTKGVFSYEYIWLLFVAPISLLMIDDKMTLFWKESSWEYQIVNFGLFVAVLVILCPFFLEAQGLPPDLWGMVLQYTGQPLPQENIVAASG